MPTDHPPRLRLLVAVVALGAATTWVAPAAAQDGGGPSTSTTTPAGDVSSSTVVAQPDTSSTLVPPDPDDPTHDEDVEAGPVPIDESTVPPSATPAGAAQVGKAILEQLDVAKADAVKLGTSYASAREQMVQLEAKLDGIEQAVSELAGDDRAAVRRVDAAKRQFQARAIAATIRGRMDDFVPDVPTGDPNEIAAGHALLGSVLNADQQALQDYLVARQSTDSKLVAIADELDATRREVAQAREAMIDARRANVSAQVNLAVLAAGSEIAIHGFVFPVGTPHSFGNSFGAPRMVGTTYQHAHQGTDILAPFGTPEVACERGIITKLGSDVLGGTTLWIKGESGTYYYYAHLSRYADGIAKGTLVDAGQIVGYVGDTGNAKGGPPHLHFEIHPRGGPAVNPYPLLKVVDQLSKQVAAQGG